MSKDAHIIIGIHVQDRVQQIPDIQKLFTEFGCNIRTRLGLHEVDEKSCATAGIIILEAIGDEDSIGRLMQALNQLDGIEVQKMVFSHD